MQFVSNGPDIPDALLQAHEEGRVVFFCGAGISYPAGLPGFEKLVTDIYKWVGTSFTEIEREAFEGKQFDATLDLLERRLPGQRIEFRSAIANVLKPKFRRQGAVDTQSALLRLGRNRDGQLRLVTTNFDRIFHTASKRTGQLFETYSAPMLPIPKKSKWDGLVFLHGLLPKMPDVSSLDRLVITSGDFGSAYLTERWAARFVSELFRNFEVCFVGYSLNDPVLRYMMDALAADRMLGESIPTAWAFGDYTPGQEHKRANDWAAKGVTPILYSVPAGSGDHSLLHKTLHAWAETYRDGVQGKEAIVVKHALARPQDSTNQDDFTGRMLWALSDPTGLPAQRFADFKPAPPLDWLLDSFTKEEFRQGDLIRFGVAANTKVDPKLTFSLIRRYAPYDKTPTMQLIAGPKAEVKWDEIMHHLARWLVRHLDDPRLIVWIASRGGNLHHSFKWLIEQRLTEISKLEKANNIAELADIRLHSPQAIPGPYMRILWRLLLTDKVKTPWYNADIYSWRRNYLREGLTASRRMELRQLLTPMIKLKKSFHQTMTTLTNSSDITSLNQLVSWELVLTANNVNSALVGAVDINWPTVFPQLFDDFQQLLLDALDLLQEVGAAEEYRDQSYWDLPSIIPHWQNRGFNDWVSLIELLRDSWLAVREANRLRAFYLAQNWFQIPYATFKRLALFAASQPDCITPEQWVEWLLTDNAWCLWANETCRETCRLLVLQGKNMTGIPLAQLESAILAGPIRERYNDELSEERWQEIVSRATWLRLVKLNESGCLLGGAASARLAELAENNPNWTIRDYERDEFPHWMSSTGDPDFVDSHDVDIAPRKWPDLVKWITGKQTEDKYYEGDTWRNVCRTRFFHSFFALRALADKSIWPLQQWREALQTWSEDALISRSWHYAAPLVKSMPNDTLKAIMSSVTYWLEATSKINSHVQVLIDMCTRVLAIESTPKGDEQPYEQNRHSPVDSAINHPIGHVSRALINLWFRSSPNDNDLLPTNLKQIFTSLCDRRIIPFRHGRVILASRLIAFYRVDSKWTEQHLLPLLNWNDQIEAKVAWAGFLWSARLHSPLIMAIKEQFLDCANYYTLLGKHNQQYAVSVTYAALGMIEGISKDEYRTAFESIPQDGIEEVAQALYQALDGSGEQREEYWKNRCLPFWRNIWPKDRKRASSRISEYLTQLCIAARNEFPSALSAVNGWIKPIEHPDYIVHLLAASELNTRYPEHALALLHAIIEDQPWATKKVRTCLDAITVANPQLVEDPRYKRLETYYRRRGM